MTRDEILAMTPAELREAIAEKLGYIHKSEYYWVTPSGRLTSILPNWPENIADAWKLFEELPHPEIYHGTYINGIDYWRCARGPWDYYEPKYECEAETAELAISRCWLMWKQEK